MKAVKLAVAVLAVFVVGLLAVASRKPDTFRVERSVVVNAQPAKVFPWLEDPRKSAEWSPWEKLDPNMKKTYSGPAKGKGAAYEWDGNSDVGAGRLEIMDVAPNERVTMELRFLRPMQDSSKTEYLLKSVSGGTEVLWTMSGRMNFVSKIMCTFMNMDKMIGGDFEKGLAALKSKVEAAK